MLSILLQLGWTAGRAVASTTVRQDQMGCKVKMMVGDSDIARLRVEDCVALHGEAFEEGYQG